MMKLNPLKKISLALASGVLFSISFTQWQTGWVMLFAFIPLLIIEEYIHQNNDKYKAGNLFLYTYLTFIVWNIISTFWIYYATAAGSFFALGLNTLFMSLLFLLYHKIKIRMGRQEAYVALVVLWLSFEYFYMKIDLSWPWLNFGNAFANNVKMIQWYEFTGTLGGTLFIIVSNLLIFEIIRRRFLESKQKKILIHTISLAAIILIPLIYSLIRYNTYENRGKIQDVVVLQPNIDPYKTKFSGSVQDQLHLMLNLADSVTDNKTDYVIFPETALPIYVNEDSTELESHRMIAITRSFNRKYPNTNLIIGLTSRKFYETESEATETAHKRSNFWFDEFNSVIQIDTSLKHQIYHKSKLVPGVEILPYINNWKWLNNLIIDLGGARNSLGYDDQPTVFKKAGNPDIKTGTAICYESIYGEYVSKFVRKGANIIFIITNDGWWRDTPGYKQHAAFARLRAIENRRSVARSANTGISSFINQRGDIIKSRGWWKEDVIKAKIKANDKLTFYSKFGDYLGRISSLLAALILLHWISYLLMKKRQ